MDINTSNTVGEWLSSNGPESDIVISSRIRLARNIKGYNFIPRLDDEGRNDVTSFLRNKLEKIDKSLSFLNLDGLSDIDLEYLVERHLISRDLAQSFGPRAVVIGAEEKISIMVNEEDHLRMQCMGSGFQLDSLWVELSNLDDSLDAEIPYAFHPQFGYLTSCPTNVGTGMRVSVMMHLPALALTNQIERVFYAVSKINLAVRGLYGEGSQASSDFYQISNQATLGKTEEETIDNLKSMVPQILNYERNARAKLFDEDRLDLEDKVYRAYGTLSSARKLTQEECLDHLSTLRLGVNLKLIDEVPISRVNELFIRSLPGHLQKGRKELLSLEEQIMERAKVVRQTLTG